MLSRRKDKEDGMTTTQQQTLTRIVVGGLVLSALALVAQLALVHSGAAPDLATQLGISTAAATKLINAATSWYVTVLLAALTGGWGAGLVAIAKKMATKYGAKYAAAW